MNLIKWIYLEGTVMLGIENLDIFSRMECLVIFNPGEFRTGFSQSGAGHVNRTTDESVSLFRMLFIPTWLI